MAILAAAVDISAQQGQRIQKLIELGIALSAERNRDRLLERILLEAKGLANADGGTLYLRTEDDALKFAIMRTDSLKIAMGGTTGKPIPFPPLRLYDPESKQPNHKNVSTHTAVVGHSVNIPDAYESKEFDFSGTKKFDQGTGYRSKSFLTVPLKNHENEVIGVLQLLNAQDPGTGEVIPFGADIQPLIEALASQAAVALDNQQLIQAQRDLLEAFIKVIAHAIDRKSPYTGGHCERVPVITEMLAEAAVEDTGIFKDFRLSEDDWYELHIAAWMHDCGKVTTPEYVVDKAKKLETIYDRIETVRARFEILRRDAEIDYLKACLDPATDKEAARRELEARQKQLDDDVEFISRINIGGEFMPDPEIERLKRIAQMSVETARFHSKKDVDELKTKGQTATEYKIIDRKRRPFLDENEVYNLSIRRGTLTAEERKVINDHIVVTIDMLEQLPFPKQLKRVPEFAGGHHEKMDGTGYPRGLKRDQMSIPARIMAIADIFEALTARDRPYKPAKKLSESLEIMWKMKKEAHVDPDLFDLFLRSGVYKKYAERFLPPEQCDHVEVEKYLGPATAEPQQKRAAG
ncbi:MAG: GAF domain-containing protein [Alphaproteobacteria bacterium]|nr:GAF domain-containing protein [Alphaproteobacteria bacterium]